MEGDRVGHGVECYHGSSFCFQSSHYSDEIIGTDKPDQTVLPVTDDGYCKTRIEQGFDGTQVAHFFNGKILGKAQMFDTKVNEFKVYI